MEQPFGPGASWDNPSGPRLHGTTLQVLITGAPIDCTCPVPVGTLISRYRLPGATAVTESASEPAPESESASEPATESKPATASEPATDSVTTAGAKHSAGSGHSAGSEPTALSEHTADVIVVGAGPAGSA